MGADYITQTAPSVLRMKLAELYIWSLMRDSASTASVYTTMCDRGNEGCLTESVISCFQDSDTCQNFHSNCFSREYAKDGSTYSDRYDDASASWVILCSIFIFFMKAGFLNVEMAFSVTQKRRTVINSKYCDFFAGVLGFWLFGFATSGNTDSGVLGEQQDFLLWFFRLLFATNAATIVGGTLVGQDIQMRIAAIIIYSFMMTAFIHPGLAYFFWSSHHISSHVNLFSPFHNCNGTFTSTINHRFTSIGDETQIVFFDVAGSGLVHVCGGVAAFVLSLFHRLEMSSIAKKLQNLPLLRRANIIEEMQRDIDAQMKMSNKSELQPVVSRFEPLWFKKFIYWMYSSNVSEDSVQSGTLGILILWTSWFAYAAASSGAISGAMNHAAVGRSALTLCLAAATGGITQSIISGLVQMYIRQESYNTNEIANAVLASLVAVTGCSPFIDPKWALVIAVVTVVLYHAGCFIEYVLKLHDGARVFPVHAISGFWGLLCVGLFGKPCLIRELYEHLCYCVTSELPSSVDNYREMILTQFIGGLFIVLWSFLLVAIVFTVLWYFPVKVALTCLPYVFSGKDNTRGWLHFEGNLLFTHHGEIDSP